MTHASIGSRRIGAVEYVTSFVWFSSTPDQNRDLERNLSSPKRRTTKNSWQQAYSSRPHLLMSVWRNLFMVTPRKFQARFKKTQALYSGNEFCMSRCATAPHASRGRYRQLRAAWQRVDESRSFSQANCCGTRATEAKLFWRYGSETPVTRAFPGPHWRFDLKSLSLRTDSCAIVEPSPCAKPALQRSSRGPTSPHVKQDGGEQNFFTRRRHFDIGACAARPGHRH